MNARLRRAGIIVGLVGTALVAMAALPAAEFPLLPESRVWVDGTSNVRSFRCHATQLNGTVDASTESFDATQLEGAVRSVAVTIPVAGLDCRNGTMNNHMRKALKATEHGSITFQLSEYTAVAAGQETRVRLNGFLEMAGQRRELDIEGVATQAANGAVRVTGSKELLMTEYGIKPPSLMMGTMKVHDRVKVEFDVVIAP